MKEQLCHCIESRMTHKLALCCQLEKSSKIKKFKDWLTEVKRVDHLLKAERVDFNVLTKATCEVSRCNTFTELSHCANMNTNNHTGTSSAYSNCSMLPKLLNSEHKLLYNNKGCLKCHCVFINHCSSNCPNDFPNASKYKTLTQIFVNMIKSHIKKSLAMVVPFEEEEALASITVVMSSLSNPVVYMPRNTSNMIKGNDGSDTSGSC